MTSSPDVQIILYDIKSQLPEAPTCTFSPFVWRIRALLAYKGIKFRTEWLEYPEIEPTAKSIGAEPTAIVFDEPHYTCPMIKDLRNDKIISDSLLIAEYLDETFPDTPRVIPAGTRPLFAAFSEAITNNFRNPVFPFIIVNIWENLNPASQPYWRRTRERAVSKKLEDVPPPEDQRKEEWNNKVMAGLDKMSKWYKNPDDIYVMGDQISFADFQLFGHFAFARRYLGTDSAEWKAFCEGQGGRWKKLMDDFAKYEC